MPAARAGAVCDPGRASRPTQPLEIRLCCGTTHLSREFHESLEPRSPPNVCVHGLCVGWQSGLLGLFCLRSLARDERPLPSWLGVRSFCNNNNPVSVSGCTSTLLGLCPPPRHRTCTSIDRFVLFSSLGASPPLIWRNTTRLIPHPPQKNASGTRPSTSLPGTRAATTAPRCRFTFPWKGWARPRSECRAPSRPAGLTSRECGVVAPLSCLPCLCGARKRVVARS